MEYHPKIELKSNGGINYTFNPEMAKKLGYKKFNYLSKFLNEYKEVVFCNESDFLNLLDEWNSQAGMWKYKPDAKKDDAKKIRKYYKENVSVDAEKITISYICPNTKKETSKTIDIWEISGYEDRMGTTVSIYTGCKQCNKNHTIYLRND